MKNKTVSVFVLKTFIAAAFLLNQNYNAQQEQDSLFHDIEVVKITKLLPKDKNKERLETSSSADLLNHDAGKFLNNIPEINGIRKAGNYATDPVLRGFKYEQLNVIIDGAANAVNACPSRMDPAVSQVNMNMVKEAEIYKGPYHFRHGAALGGTINFVTLNPNFTDKTEFSGRVTTGYESNGNIFRNELLTTVSSKNMVWDLFGGYQNGDSYEDGNGDKVRSAFKRYNLGTKGNFKWNDNNISTIQVNTNQGRDVEFAALNMDLIYDKTWMFQGKHLAKFDGLLKHFDFNSYLSLVDHSMGTPNRMMVSDVKSTTYGGRGELKFAKNKSTFYIGLDFKSEAAENIRMTMPANMKMRDGTAWQDSEIQQIGWFNEFQHIFGRGKLSASYRMDYNTSDAKEVSNLFNTLYGDVSSENLNHSMSLGYSHSLDKHSMLSLWMGRGQRSASLTERYINLFTVGIDGYEMLGNPLLDAETNNQVDLIYTYKRENVYFQIDGFYSYLQDYISGVVNPNVKKYSMIAPGVRQYMNIEKAYKTGAEANFNWQFLPFLRTEMAVAYTYAEDLTTKDPLPEIAPVDFRWRFIADFDKVNLGLKYRYSGKQDRINPNFGELKTAAFSVFDFDVRYEAFKNGYLVGSVNNIFDVAYAEHLSRAFSTDKTRRILSPGRSFGLAFTYSF